MIATAFYLSGMLIASLAFLTAGAISADESFGLSIMAYAIGWGFLFGFFYCLLEALQ